MSRVATLGSPSDRPSDRRLYARRVRLHPRSVSGRFRRMRAACAVATQVVYYGLPWWRIDGRPAVLFDLEARRFDVFGVILWPQDFVWLAGLLAICAFSLFFVTTIAGRVWCGYACPQTVYTDLFRALERRIEGDRAARMRLDRSPPSWGKTVRRMTKWGAWIALGAWTGFTFVGYFVPIRAFGASLLALEPAGWPVFWMAFYGGFTVLQAGVMREQVCKYMCPYARFQSAMFDRDTRVVAYDAARGEPRGVARLEARGTSVFGDCVDCGLCLQVCPTGIDIRDGLQYECIGCAACIDVCDRVMTRLKRPRGLIDYVAASGASVLRPWTRPRALGYGAVLIAACAVWIATFAARPSLRIDVLRDRTVLARTATDGGVENVYRLQFINARDTARAIRIEAEGEGLGGVRVDLDEPPVAAAEATTLVVARVRADSAASPGPRPLRLHVSAEGLPVEIVPTTFYVPREH